MNDFEPKEPEHKILIGIPTCARPQLLLALIRSLEALEGVEPHRIEIFIADNDPGGRDGIRIAANLEGRCRWPLTAELVEECGISAARNAILDQAFARNADFVAMIDDDETAEPQWLAELLRQQRMTTADVVAGPVLYRFERRPSRAIEGSGAFPPKRRQSGVIEIVGATGNVLMSCEALRRAGCPHFDPAFGLTGGEDKEYFARIRENGIGFAWADEAVAWETIPSARTRSSWVLRRAFRIGNNDLRITRLHEGPMATLVSLGKAAAILASAPLLAPALLFTRTRLWLLRKWWRSAGTFAALMNVTHEEYAGRDRSDVTS